MTQVDSYPRRRDLRDGAAQLPGPRDTDERHALVDAPQVPSAGRHASGRGDGFGRTVGLTALGALVPGSVLVMSGRRRLGWSLLGLLALGLLGAGVLVLSGRAVPLGMAVATSPTSLLVAAGAAVLGGSVWATAVVLGHRAVRAPRPTRSQSVLATTLVVCLVALVALPTAKAAQYALAQRSLLLSVFGGDGDRSGLANPDLAAADPWATTPRVNVLLVGSDAGRGRTGVRPDTLMVASIDTATGDSVLLTLPRNLVGAPFAPGSEGAAQYPNGFTCPSESGNACLLNAVWQWGAQHPDAYPGSAEPGLAATREVVGQTLGLTIDYHLTVNLQGFVEVVDAMGGLTMDVGRDIPIGGGTDQATGEKNPITGYIRAGQGQRLDGFQSLWFARSREGSDDYDRMLRQRCTVSAAVQQFDVISLAQRFPALAASAERNISSDVPTEQLPAFLALGQRVKGGELRSVAFTDKVIKTGHPDFAKIRSVVEKAIAPPAAPKPKPKPEPSASPSTSAPAPSASPTPAPAEHAPDEAASADEVC